MGGAFWSLSGPGRTRGGVSVGCGRCASGAWSSQAISRRLRGGCRRRVSLVICVIIILLMARGEIMTLKDDQAVNMLLNSFLAFFLYYYSFTISYCLSFINYYPNLLPVSSHS